MNILSGRINLQQQVDIVTNCKRDNTLDWETYVKRIACIVRKIHASIPIFIPIQLRILIVDYIITPSQSDDEYFQSKCEKEALQDFIMIGVHYNKERARQGLEPFPIL